jgi:membrane metallo-endopeptidase-like protein 1
MLELIRTQFYDTLPKEEWMAEEDRKAAQDKLQAMFFQVAYPTDKEDKIHWPQETFSMDGKMTNDFMTNYMLGERLSIEKDFDEIAKAPNRRSWGGNSPLEVNAFYGSDANGLWIPAGILQSPFFDAANSDARNFGSIGSVLGHEMSHGFDDNGRQYDARGELHDWWSQETVDRYKERSSCIADLFSTYTIAGRKVNGKYTLGEDIADAGGLKFSYQAFLAKQPRSAMEKRMFFTSFAQTWCSVQRRNSAVSSVLSDTHAPSKFRVLGGLSQFPGFAEAFQCPVGSPMAPEHRCSLW